MISANEARKVTAEALDAKKKKQTIEQARKLNKLFEVRMKDADTAVKAAMKRGEDSVPLKWSHDEYPRSVQVGHTPPMTFGDRFEGQVTDAGFGIQVHPGDDGDGWEVVINWKGA